jgi:hypothetical protein
MWVQNYFLILMDSVVRNWQRPAHVTYVCSITSDEDFVLQLGRFEQLGPESSTSVSMYITSMKALVT